MKKLLLIFIMAIGFASTASANKDTVMYTGTGTWINGGSAMIPSSATITVNIGDTIVFFSSAGYTLNYMVNTTPFNSITNGQYFQYKIVGADVPSFTVTATYMTFTQPVITVYVNNITTGVDQNTNKIQFNSFPNPATDELKISNSEKLGKISITNLIGQVVYSAISNDKQTSIDVSTLPQGAYIVSVGGVFKKIIKE